MYNIKVIKLYMFDFENHFLNFILVCITKGYLFKSINIIKFVILSIYVYVRDV